MRTTGYYDRIEEAALAGKYQLGPMSMSKNPPRIRTFAFEVQKGMLVLKSKRNDEVALVWLDDGGRFTEAVCMDGYTYKRDAFTLFLEALRQRKVW